MEKRYLLFVILSIFILIGWTRLRTMFFPPPQQAQLNDQLEQPPVEEAEQPDAGDASSVQPTAETLAEPKDSPDIASEKIDGPPEAQKTNSLKRVTLGSVDPSSPYPFLVTVSSQGASIERIELSSSKYRSLGSLENRRAYGHRKHGYLGQLALSDLGEGDGCRIGVVGHGTPAAQATAGEPGVPAGLLPGDVIKSVDGEPLPDRRVMIRRIRASQPGDTLELKVERSQDQKSRLLPFTVQLGDVPLGVVRPESERLLEPTDEIDPLSFLLSLEQLGSTSVDAGAEEIRGIRSLRDSQWQLTQETSSEAEGGEQVVEFTLKLDRLQTIGQSGNLVVVRRYRLSPLGEDGDLHYHLTMEVEFRNDSDQAKQIAYRLDGPNGLPLEGWWFLYKVHPKWGSAGARDIVWRPEGGPQELIGCSTISKQASKAPQSPNTKITDRADLRYIGVDTQYFATLLMPSRTADTTARPLTYSTVLARPVGVVDAEKYKRTNCSFRLISEARTVEPHDTLSQSFDIFTGPKDPDVLAHYGLEDVIVYGWFWFVAKPMISLLDFFGQTGSYGLAIILLTVLVRGCMFPLGRRQAQMAAKMQELAPEMKQIADKYKNDMEKKAKAQQELFKRHNYHPLSGCLPMIFQLPIFIGLYRALSVDIELRGAPLIPGVSWCSNLAAPDQAWFWRDLLPDFLSAPTGFLGPYLNVLPLVTIVFFMAHQKLFTPPATDEQTAMQQKMMKFMLVFMGFIFFKVAAGLCLYIIASSAWGVAERLLLPKTKPKTGDEKPAQPVPQKTLRTSGNGSTKKANRGRKQTKGKR